MKVVFKTDAGTLTWESSPDMNRRMKETKLDQKHQAAALSTLFMSTAKLFSGLIEAANLGFPGTPREQVAFLNEIDAGIRRLVGNYIKLHG